MYKALGWIIGFIAGLGFAILIITLGDFQEKFVFISIFLALFIVAGTVKIFNSVQKKKDLEKSESAAYFFDIKTKEWLRKKVVHPMLHGRKKSAFTDEKIPGILTYHDDFMRYNNTVGYDISNAIQLSYEISEDSMDSLWKDYIWSEYYNIIKTICETRDDFTEDLKQIDIAYKNYMRIFPNGKVLHGEKEFSLKDLKPFHEMNVFRKLQKEDLQNKLGITYEELVEINRKTIAEQKKLRDTLEKTVNSFVEHYSKSF